MLPAIVAAYARMGYAVLPLEPSEKRPLARLVPNGLKNATTDLTILERWAATAPDCNWGLLPPEEVLVLDVDEPQAWPALLAQYPDLAAAPRQRTPRGGVHVFLRLPSSSVGRLSASARAMAGVDVRGLGKAYIAVFPSRVGGKEYAWDRALKAPAALPAVPPGLLERLLPAPSPTSSPPSPAPEPVRDGAQARLDGLLNWACSEVAATPEGARHTTLLAHARLIGGWLHHGLSEAEAHERLVQAGMAAGLPADEARATARDGLAYGKRDPLDLPAAPAPARASLHRHRGEEPRSPARGPHPLEERSGGGEIEGQPRYVVRGGMIHAARVDGKGESRSVSYWPLANFACIIAREVRATDGLESEVLFELEGALADGQKLPRAVVRAGEFSGMGWVVREWGARAVVSPVQGAKDHLRAAIQYLSKGVERATVYRHLGWIQHDGRFLYLHAGGALAAGEPVQVEVAPGRTLEGFTLPDPPTTPTEAARIRQVWELLAVAPLRVMVPLLLYALAAPLGHAPYSLYLAGPSGARKTSLALVVQSLYGYREPTPPLGWTATVNALEAAAFAAKDCLLLVDDYAPSGNERATNELVAKASRLLRSQGNAVGRLRMRPDGSILGDRPPRGSLLVTGEDLPPGHSVRARTLFLELRSGEVDLERLSAAQLLAREGVYAEAMAGWIRHLAPWLAEAQGGLRALTEELRPRWAAEHGRTTDALARLHATWMLYAEYARKRGVDLDALEHEVIGALERVRDDQRAYHRDADPVQRFVGLLFTALRMGRCHVVPLEAAPTAAPEDHIANPADWGWQYRPAPRAGEPGHWLPQGPRIGWVPRDWEVRGVYLDPSAAWATVNRLAAETCEPLPSERTLWKRLAERGVIRTSEEDGKLRYQVRVRVHGHPTRAVHLFAPSLSGNIDASVAGDDRGDALGGLGEESMTHAAEKDR